METYEEYRVRKIRKPRQAAMPISISLSLEQLEFLDNLAERAGLTRSAFIRIKLGLETPLEVLKERVEDAYK